MSSERAEAFEDALSDVVLFGTSEQIGLARAVGPALVEGGRAPIDDLLVSLRRELRGELDLPRDGMAKVPVVRFDAPADDDSPLTTQEAWKVATDNTLTAVASSVSIPRERAATTPYIVDLTSQVEGLRKLARAAPGAGVVTSYGHVVAALRGLLDAPDDDPRDAPELARAAEALGLVTALLVQTIDGLAVLKNLSRDGGSGTGLTVDKADDYIDLVAAALYILYSASPGP